MISVYVSYLVGVLTGMTIVGVYDVVHGTRERNRINNLMTMMNPGYATSLCTVGRNMVSQEAYKKWIESSEAHWNERASIPAPEIFTQQEVSDETHHSIADGD